MLVFHKFFFYMFINVNSATIVIYTSYKCGYERRQYLSVLKYSIVEISVKINFLSNVQFSLDWTKIIILLLIYATIL